MDIKGYIEKLQAKLQGEVGRFLILKERILALPQGDRRTTLLNRQNDLEGRAMKLAADAAALKEATKFKGVEILKMFSGDKIKQASDLVNSGGKLIGEMNSHTQDVNAATGQTPKTAAGGGMLEGINMQIAQKVALVAVTAYAVNWAWRGARGFAKRRA